MNTRMTILIITDNSYLELALKHLCVSQSVGSGLLFIDLDSFHSLSDMMKSLRQQKINDDVRVCLLGSCGVNFRMLSRFKPIEINDNLKKIMGYISSRKFSALFEVKAFKKAVDEMSIFSNRQQQCLYALKRCGEVSAASQLTGLSEKTVYSIIRSAGEKINLTSLLQVRQFLSMA